MTLSKQQWLGGILVFLAALSWSTAGLFTRIVHTDIPTTLFGRSIFGGLCVFAIYGAMTFREKKPGLLRFSKGEFVIAAISAAGMVCFISSFFFTTIATVSFIYGIMPLVTLLLAWAVLREKVTVPAVTACVISGTGVVALVWGKQDFNHWTGISLAFLMTIMMSSLTIAAKSFPNANMIRATYLSAFLSALIMLPFTELSSISMHDLCWLFIYGFVNVGMGFGVYLLGVSRISALSAALLGLAEIPLAPVWALCLFNEKVPTRVILGGALIILASTAYLLSTTYKHASLELQPGISS